MAYGDGWQDPRDAVDTLNSSYGAMGGDNTQNRVSRRRRVMQGAGGMDDERKGGPINMSAPNNMPTPPDRAGQSPFSSALPDSNSVIMNRTPAQTPVFQPVIANRQPSQNLNFTGEPNPYIPAREQGPVQLPYSGPPPSQPTEEFGARPRKAAGPVDFNRNEIAEARPLQHAIEQNQSGPTGPSMEMMAMADYSGRVQNALQQMNSDQHREDRYNSIRAMLAPPPNPHDVANAELNQGGLFRRFTRRLGQVGIGALKGLAIGGPGGAIAGAVLGGTGDIYRHDRTAQLIDDYARRRQAGEDALAVQKQEDAADQAAERVYNYQERSDIQRENNQLRYQLGQQGNTIKQQTADTKKEALEETKTDNQFNREYKQGVLADKNLRTIGYLKSIHGQNQRVVESEDGQGLFMLDKETNQLIPVPESERYRVVLGNPTTARIASEGLRLRQNADQRAAAKEGREERKETEANIKTKKSADVKERLYNEELTKQAKGYGFVNEAGQGDPSKIPDALRADLENDARDAADERYKKEGWDAKVGDKAKRRAAGEPSRKEREKEKKTKSGPVAAPPAAPPAPNPFTTGIAGAISSTGNIFGEPRKRPGT